MEKDSAGFEIVRGRKVHYMQTGPCRWNAWIIDGETGKPLVNSQGIAALAVDVETKEKAVKLAFDKYAKGSWRA